MPWNKIPEHLEDEIVHFLNIALDSTYEEIGKLYGVSSWKVSELARQYLTKEVKTLRYSLVNKKAKMGEKNPMFGLTRLKHHNSKIKTICCGYETEWAPNWWTGHQPKPGRCYVHQRVWCEANGKTEVLPNHVIHHKDENKLNNSIENLECLTRREHAQLHQSINTLKRCNDYSTKEVGNSVSEAQSLQTGG